MPTPSLDVTLRDTNTSVGRLEKYRNDSIALASTYQYLIAELIMLRLFAIVEGAIADVAYKLAAGATYTSGHHPTLLFAAKSITGARAAMLTHERPRARQFLRWTRSKDIRDSTSKVLSPTEPFLTYAQAHGNLLDEMTKVRNFLAHRNSDSRQGYRQVIRAVYGANSKVGIGAFLTSNRRRPTQKVKIDEYLAESKIIIADLARG